MQNELLGGQKAPPLPQMSDVKTAAELEANIKRMVGIQGDEPSPNLEPRKISPQPQQKQPNDGEMSAFKKFVSFI